MLMRSDTFGAVGQGPAARPRTQHGQGFIARVMLRFEAYMELRRQRHALMQLDEHMLKDIGLSRGDVDRIVSQPHDWNRY